MHQIRFPLGFTPEPTGGAYSVPQTSSCRTSKRGGREEKGKEREKKEGERKRGEGDRRRREVE